MNREYPVMPQFGKTALERLDQRFAEPHSLSSKYGTRFFMGLIGTSGALAANWATKRPFKAGAWRYPLAFAGGWTVGEFVYFYRQRYLAERDAILRQYIELHPEDFQPEPRVKWGSLLEKWVPIR